MLEPVANLRALLLELLTVLHHVLLAQVADWLDALAPQLLASPLCTSRPVGIAIPVRTDPLLCVLVVIGRLPASFWWS